MSLETNRALIHRLFDETFNGNQLDLLDEICADDILVQSPLFPMEWGVKDGRNAFKNLMKTYRHVHPDMVYTLENLVVEETAAAIDFSYVGTHAGDLPDIPATGEVVKVTGLCFIESNAEGKISLIRFCPYGPMPSALKPKKK